MLGGRLRIAEALPKARVLTSEMLGFQAKFTAAANEVYGTWREGPHDDIVLALAIVLWYASAHQPPPTITPVGIT